MKRSLGSAEVDFEADGFYDGRPYRFGPDGSIYSIDEGRIVRFRDFDDFVTVSPRESRPPLLGILLAYGVTLCVSMLVVQHWYAYIPVVHFDDRLLIKATLNALPSLGLIFVVARSRASFGFALSLYSLTIVIGFCWLAPFSPLAYDKDVGTLSILISTASFILPAIFLALPMPRFFTLSHAMIESLLIVLIVLSAIILAFSSTHHFQLVGVDRIYDYRDQLDMPVVLRYAGGIAVGALLPYAFTLFIMRRRWFWTSLSALVLVGFFAVSLSKLALFAPAWLLFLYVLLRFAETRIAVVLSLFVPLSVGLIVMVPRAAGFGDMAFVNPLFGLVNFRMFAIPAISLDLYNDFFAHHPLTGFCQVSWLKPLISCPYTASVAEELASAYHFGNLNGSLFATEGIASVGPMKAPLTASVCGIVVAVANAMSRHWPQRYVILSAGVALQGYLTIPFSTMLLTNGAGLLFILWYVTPESYFVSSEHRPPR
jgi:hypothetical protein